MSDWEEEEIDDGKHRELLSNIFGSSDTKADASKFKLKKGATEKVNVADMISALKGKSGIDTVKKSFGIHTAKDFDKMREKAKSDDQLRGSGLKSKTLVAPMNRRMHDKLQGQVAYKDVKDELGEWQDVVVANRVSDQLSFPLYQENLTKLTNADRVSGIIPRTSLEQRMAAMIGASKNILSNERALTEAEAELMKAMDEQVANEKVKQLQRERRLMSFRAAKNVYTAKIKSKKYHKIKKRSNRRKLVKEFEDLVTKDPEAAKAKLAELEKDRLMERATLRHRTTGKWNKNLIKYAARNEGVKKIMQDHMQFGRELKAKLLGVDPDDLSDSDEEEQTPEVIGNKKKEYQTFLAMVAEEASKEHDKAEKVPDNIASALLDGHNPWLKTGLLKLRSAIKQKEEAKRGFRTQLTKSKAIANMELDDGWTIVGAGQEEYPVTKSDMDADQEGAMKETLSEEESEDEECDGNGKKEDSSIDDIFDAYFNSLIKTTKDEEEAAQRQDDLEALEKAESNYVETAPGLKRKGDQEGPVAAKSAKIDIDISLDPSKYLKLVTSEVDSIDETVNDHLDGQARINAFDQTNIIAEAFEDDDVLVEFEKHKAMVEDFESVKDVDLTLHGWGSWTGQTIAKKSKPEYVLKAPINERKDAKNRGLIMLESVDSAISKLQPTDVPFPYTSSKVFEAVAKQPLGMDWNPATTTKKMTKPVVRTRLGKIIRPISKIETMKGRKVGLDK